MGQVRRPSSLVSLCVEAIKTQLLITGGVLITDLYDLPPDLFDLLVSELPPLPLENLQFQMPFKDFDGYEPSHCSKQRRKRGRKGNFDAAWKSLFKLRWRELADRIEPGDWQQVYWETHLQDCFDEAVELASIPLFSARLGETKMSEGILKFIGCEGNMESSTITKLSSHCQHFAKYVRHLRLQTVLCVEETSLLLEKCKLQSLELRGVRSREHVDGLCRLLIQNSRTLKSLELIHCKLSSSFISAICGSLQSKDLQAHGVEQLSIKLSSFLEMDPNALPDGLLSFLSSGRSLYKLKFHGNLLDQDFARLLFATLVDGSSNLSILDLSDNDIAGWLANFDWRSNSFQSSLGTSNFLKSLRVLNLKANNLHKVDMDSLGYALAHMCNLEAVDLSDNAIRDSGIRSLMRSFLGDSEKCSSLAELRLDNCELFCDGVTLLLGALSTWKEPLKSLSLADNYLDSNVAGTLGEFLSSHIEVLNVGGIGLGSAGFQTLHHKMIAAPKLVEINIRSERASLMCFLSERASLMCFLCPCLDSCGSLLQLVCLSNSKNRGGLETANFLSKLISLAPNLVAIDAAYNFMPVESLDIICTALNVQKGNLERLDLNGNTWELQPSQLSVLDRFQRDGRPILTLPSANAPDLPYDDEP